MNLAEKDEHRILLKVEKLIADTEKEGQILNLAEKDEHRILLKVDS